MIRDPWWFPRAPEPFRTQRILADLALLFVFTVPLAGCGGTRAERERDAAPAPVRVARFAGGDAGGAVLLPARVKATEEVTIRARIGARLTRFEAREGDRVRRGDVLARFDAPETRRALAAAEAEAEAASLTRAAAVRQHSRIESLFVAGVVALRDRDLAETERRSAEAREQSARAALELLETGTAVRAPFDGVVVRRHVDAGADLAPGVALLDLRSSDGVEIVADVPEGSLEPLARSPLQVQVGDGPWRRARLARVDGMTDFRSRTRSAHLVPDGPRDLEPGAFARVAIGAPAAAGRRLPSSSLVRRGALAGVFVIDGAHARLRWLKLGREERDGVQVLAGLEAGETFALDARGLADGRRVEVRP